MLRDLFEVLLCIILKAFILILQRYPVPIYGPAASSFDWNVIDDITARLPADAAGCDEPVKHKAAPKILNVPSRVKTLISKNNYLLREAHRQISFELSNGAPSQKVGSKRAKLIWIKGEASGQARARSLCRVAERCLHT